MDKYLRTLVMLEKLKIEELESFIDTIISERNTLATNYVFEKSGSRTFSWVYHDESYEELWGNLSKYDDDKVVDEAYRTYDALITELAEMKARLKRDFEIEADEEYIGDVDDYLEENYDMLAAEILDTYDESGIGYAELLKSGKYGDSDLLVSEIESTVTYLKEEGQSIAKEIKNGLGYGQAEWEDVFTEQMEKHEEYSKKNLIKTILEAG